MPELPEVETIMQGLRPALERKKFHRVYVNRPDLRKPFPQNLKEVLENRTVLSLRRRAKYILIDLEDEWTLLLHLGMSGRIFIDTLHNPFPTRKHEHLILETYDHKRIALVDPRRFGMVDLFRTSEENTHSMLGHLGVEPLSENLLTAEYMQECFSNTRTPIKNALLDQRKVAGLGNIYVCEALFQARIHPERAAHTVTFEEHSRLIKIIPDILRQALAAGGSTLRDYVHTDGRKGGFQELHRVYGREGEKCVQCMTKNQTTLIERITQSGRSTFFCPQCQKKVYEITPRS